MMKKISILLFLASFAAFAACSSGTETATNSANNSAMPVNRIETKNVSVQVTVPLDRNGNVNLAAVVKPNKEGVGTMGASRPAPDNSEIFTELKEEPIETRIFKNHPQLIKVVKSGIPPKQTIKVYLKNGKVVSLPGEKIPNLGVEPAADILQAAGVQPPPPPAAPGDTRGTTKKQ